MLAKSCALGIMKKKTQNQKQKTKTKTKGVFGMS